MADQQMKKAPTRHRITKENINKSNERKDSKGIKTTRPRKFSRKVLVLSNSVDPTNLA